MDKNKMKKIIVREGLIILGIIMIGNFLIFTSLILRPTLDEILNAAANNAPTPPLYKNFPWGIVIKCGWGIILLGYPAYLLIRFVFWAAMLSRAGTMKNIDEQTVKRVIGLKLFGASLIFILSSCLSLMLNNQNLHRFFFCIFCAIFALSLRAFFYIPMLKKYPIQNMEEENIKKANIYYFYYAIFLLIFSCFIYLAFYNTIAGLSRSVFYVLFAFLFGALALVVAPLIAFVLDKASKFIS